MPKEQEEEVEEKEPESEAEAMGISVGIPVIDKMVKILVRSGTAPAIRNMVQNSPLLKKLGFWRL